MCLSSKNRQKLLADGTPKPELTEVKHVYQNIKVTPVDLLNGKAHLISIKYLLIHQLRLP